MKSILQKWGANGLNNLNHTLHGEIENRAMHILQDMEAGVDTDMEVDTAMAMEVYMVMEGGTAMEADIAMEVDTAMEAYIAMEAHMAMDGETAMEADPVTGAGKAMVTTKDTNCNRLSRLQSGHLRLRPWGTCTGKSAGSTTLTSPGGSRSSTPSPSAATPAAS